MKGFCKILLFVISLIGLGLSVGMLSLFAYIPVITDTVIQYQGFFPWLNSVFAAYGIFMAACFFLLLLAAVLYPARSNELIFVKSKGKLQFSKQTVESAVRYSFADVDGINFSKVRARIGRKPEKTRIYVKLSLNDPSKMADLTGTVQEKIESVLKASLDMTAESINIKVAELDQGEKAPKENDAGMVKDSRVI